MITAIDSSILLDVFRADPQWGQGSADALRRARSDGRLVVCEAVWVETATVFEDAEAYARRMADLGVGFDPMLQPAADQAATFWRRYRVAGGPRTRVAADFLIGAHAAVQADRLLTRDGGFYRNWFSGLVLFGPGEPRGN